MEHVEDEEQEHEAHEAAEERREVTQVCVCARVRRGMEVSDVNGEEEWRSMC